jgi:hypothetical protein
MNFTIANYEFELNGYSNKPYSSKEYKTVNIDNNNDDCNIINTIEENQYNFSINSITTSDVSSSSDISSSDSVNTSEITENKKQNRTKINYYSKSNASKLRSCDYFGSTLIETDNDIKLNINDNNKSLFFELKYDDIIINSYDLIKFLNVYGAKKLQKNFEYGKIFKNFKNSDILKLYDKNNSLKIMKKIQELFILKLPDSNKIHLFDYNKIKLSADKTWNKNNKDLKILENLFDYVDNYIIKLYNNYDEKASDSYIKYISPSKNEKIIILGDFHGSFSTFIRHLLRFKKIGIIDNNGIIKGDYKIIFLGDLVDRGIYSYEILMILYLLVINNPEKIIINNGNHEEFTTNGRLVRDLYGENSKNYSGNLINELLSKFKNVEEVLEVYTEFTNITKLQSIAIYCEIPSEKDKYIFLCHGCLPHEHENSNSLNKILEDNIKNKKSFFIKNNIGTSIKWNDFYGNSKSISSQRSYEDNCEIQRIGKNVLDDAIKLGIVMVIRGHEDLNHNTKIMKNNNHQWDSIKILDNNNNNACKSKDDIFGNMTHIIKVNEKNNNLIINDEHTEYLPILTISTNTDLGKNLTFDSYVMLSFGKNNNKRNCQYGGYRYLYEKYMEKIINI